VYTCHPRRVLEDIKLFSEERSKRGAVLRKFKKQSDADDIKKWDQELRRAYERFNVRFKDLLIHRHILKSRNRSMLSLTSKLEPPIFRPVPPLFMLLR
jgi:hypothetical protein